MSHYPPGGGPYQPYPPEQYLDRAYTQPGNHYVPTGQQNYNQRYHTAQGSRGPGTAQGSRGPGTSHGILKPSGSYETRPSTQDLKWDEKNIKETFHPANKTYGFMNIDEPKTPYSYDMSHEKGPVNAEVLAQKIQSAAAQPPTATLSPEQLKKIADEERAAKHRKFEEMRKKHYHMEMRPAGSVPDDDEDEEDDD